ncbi:TonB-dependent receptor [Insolitispirillum peregrinum]|uniref:Catecholate siderophore receptor n=1 Tax=Insolitispirillum peregrinum TaxID=80876 RepID=A0A1N7Q1B0_9PROT|nr:TonB-dependent siderophore receptor [Insolitispirillum peregrinum]SIT16632.1 catecholate siderophore receptor [Insolitispirillum peregrinum]
MPQPSVSTPTSLRPVLSGVAATASLAVGLSSLSAAAQAQSAPTVPPVDPAQQTVAPDNNTVVLAPVKVNADAVDEEAKSNVNNSAPRISRLPETVKETPRVINVVPQEVIEQQKATSLDQVLRNVPGITVSTGEGNGGQNGDQFRIRGLSARGDIYSDGLKDFGVYTHDVFNTETVQVIKGPSGDGFGVGNSGGLINQSTKQASLTSKNTVQQSIGSGSLTRTTADINQKISDTVALRVNALYHDQETPDRDGIEAERKGVAADLGVGLGTDTVWHLNYAYLHGDQTPDMGQSMVRGGDGLYRPAAEYGLDSTISYARNLDRDITENHVVTSTLSHQISDSLSVYNDTRWSLYERDFAATNPAALTSVAALNGNLTYGAGGGMAYKQDGWGIQNISGVKAEGSVLGLKTKATGGLDLNYQEDTRQTGTWRNRTNTQSVQNPTHSYAANAYIDYLPSGIRSSSVENIGVFANDRLWLTEDWSVQGGVRFDYFRTSFRSANGTIANGKDIAHTISPSGSVIYEPTKDASLYATYSQSNKPIGTDIAAAITNGTAETPNNNRNFEPEQTNLYEFGGKADFLDKRLGLNGAVFLIDKSNTYSVASDGTVTDGFSEAGMGTRTKGFETGISGKVTPAWTVYANYAFLTAEVKDSRSAPATVGNDAPNTPKHNASLWSTYDLKDVIGTTLPGKMLVGGGVRYASQYWTDSANTAVIPETFTVDAMVSYEYENLSLSLNGYNLTDHQNYLSGFGATRAVPASGQTWMLTTGVTF